MGVPRLYTWIRKNFENAVRRFQQGEYRMSIDYFYLDGNSFLHAAAQEVYNYGKIKRRMDIYKNMSDEAKRRKVYLLFFETIIELTQMIMWTIFMK